MRIEYVVVSIILIMIVLIVVLSIASGILPGFKQGLGFLFGQIPN